MTSKMGTCDFKLSNGYSYRITYKQNQMERNCIRPIVQEIKTAENKQIMLQKEGKIKP